MGQIITTRSLPASADQVWAIISNLERMPEWNRTVSSTSLQGDGLGARRTSKLYDGTSLTEEITSLDSARMTLGFDVFDAPSPLATLQGEFRVVSTGDQTSELSFEIDYTLVMGILGVALDALVVRAAIRAEHASILEDFEHYLLTGVHIGADGERLSAAAAK